MKKKTLIRNKVRHLYPCLYLSIYSSYISKKEERAPTTINKSTKSTMNQIIDRENMFLNIENLMNNENQIDQVRDKVQATAFEENDDKTGEGKKYIISLNSKFKCIVQQIFIFYRYRYSY